MEITIRVDDVLRYGYSVPYYLSYLKQKGGNVTMAEMISDLGFSESAIRGELNTLERMGLIKKHYEKVIGKRGGRKPLVRVEIL